MTKEALLRFIVVPFSKRKKVFELLTIGAGSPACRHQGRKKVSIPECDFTGRRVMVDLPPVRSHTGIDTFVCHDGGAPEVLLPT